MIHGSDSCRLASSLAGVDVRPDMPGRAEREIAAQPCAGCAEAAALIAVKTVAHDRYVQVMRARLIERDKRIDQLLIQLDQTQEETE